ncbi:LRR domain containing protein [Trema orientale]|uniref:LRR domain containing protein n=1 Tax=Trema orientale TaxID=63057 RepID=A0A2P5E6E1_TREOI|nr:LRR domain containing protein [Trema orientale]
MDLVAGSAASTSLAIDKLVSLLTGEENLLEGVEILEVHTLRQELKHLTQFLEEVDDESSDDEEYLKNWSKQVKELAELIEDVIDDYIYEVSQPGFIKFLGKAGRLIGTLNSRRNLASNIQNIKVLLLDIKERGQRYKKLSGSRLSRRITAIERIKEGFGCLENLQTLMTVEATHLTGIGLVKELDKLRRLRRLGISRLTTEVASALCPCIEEMSHLECLSLDSTGCQEILDLHTISSPSRFLQRLVLKGILQNLPQWVPSLRNLSMLYLSFSRLTKDPLDHLCHLPNLVSLSLYKAYDGVKLHFEEGGFPRLKLLVLRELHGLVAVEVEEGALPRLEELRIGSSPLLKEVPSGIQHLRNLKVLANYDMPSEFVFSMQPDEGSDYWKVEHIQFVIFWYRVEGTRYMLYKLGEPELLDHLQDLETNITDSPQSEARLSFYCSDDEEDSVSTWNDVNRLSFSSPISFFSDDIED